MAGQRAAPALETQYGGVDTDPQANARLANIGSRLVGVVPDVPGNWQFRVLTSDKVNAFSLPGGLVYITRGLYDRVGDDDGLLAAAVAHEMAHVAHKDSLKPACGSVEQALARETTADGYGLQCLTAAGYPARCMIALLERTADAHPHGWANVRIRRLAERQDTSPDRVRVVALR